MHVCVSSLCEKNITSIGLLIIHYILIGHYKFTTLAEEERA